MDGEPVMQDDYEIGRIERHGNGLLFTSRVDNERMTTQDRSAGIAWLHQLWNQYFSRKR